VMQLRATPVRGQVRGHRCGWWGRGRAQSSGEPCGGNDLPRGWPKEADADRCSAVDGSRHRPLLWVMLGTAA
jgi:hypothetical protein